MAPYYATLLDLADKPVVVIGGGPVGEGKISNLLECGAQVTLIAPEVTPQIQQWSRASQLTWMPRCYQPGDLTGAWIAIVGADDPAVNQRAADEARRLRVPVNTVDDVKNCDFIVPALVRRGDIVLAISTGGGSPALARFVREELQRTFPAEYAQLAEVLADARKEVRRRGVRPHADRWQECMDGGLLDLVRAGALNAARSRLVAMLVAQPEPTPAAGDGEHRSAATAP